MKNKFFDLCTIGNLILIFGSSMMLFTALLFIDTSSGKQDIPLLSPLFILPYSIFIVGVIIMYIGRKKND